MLGTAFLGQKALETPLVTVQVVVPYRGGCPHRERAWRWVRERYGSIHPDWEVVEAPAPEGPWSKGAAVNPALEASSAEVVIIADADVFCEGLERCVYAIISGLATWGMPHRKVLRLDEAGTADFIAGGVPVSFAQRPYEGVWGGGVVVGQGEALLDAPLDTRFKAWGQEDVSWALALQTLHGTGWRGDADLIHLFHPPQERMTRQKGSRESWELYLRYRKARNDPEAMRALIAEAKEDAWAPIV
jgi:hypothetical protein